MLCRNHKDQLQFFEEKLRREYIDKEGDKRRIKVEEMCRKMDKVMANWLGLSMEEVFKEWREITRNNIRRRRKDERNKNKARRIEYDEKLARLELARIEVRSFHSFISISN